MSKSFYHYLVNYRHAIIKTDISRFANAAYEDHSFPKQSKSYHEISNYLELNVHYLPSMTIFDEAWDLYIRDEQ
ncbi:MULTISPECIES: YozE family protein [Sutcliffiella]|uniref:UPF0346 protein BC6307_10990 n=1 Tax=Sutcliffiella cohnii TaxID=33932 RepID=A0A223KQV5_9BACI|nr:MULTISPECIES: YozE family protein [Sutcliffiella]AST91767.1 hypothetical protein BC6307_10990 [Sutcliffiella cohnii]MED4014678.1 YozE family protein [Sutcliffiella cohnii]WBL12983.1 YozE family protein [Sutcliffiella sp. NC1]